MLSELPLRALRRLLQSSLRRPANLRSAGGPGVSGRGRRGPRSRRRRVSPRPAARRRPIRSAERRAAGRGPLRAVEDGRAKRARRELPLVGPAPTVAGQGKRKGKLGALFRERRTELKSAGHAAATPGTAASAAPGGGGGSSSSSTAFAPEALGGGSSGSTAAAAGAGAADARRSPTEFHLEVLLTEAGVLPPVATILRAAAAKRRLGRCQCRSLVWNLRRNEELLERVNSRKLSPWDLLKMSHQALAGEDARLRRDQLLVELREEDGLQDHGCDHQTFPVECEACGSAEARGFMLHLSSGPMDDHRDSWTSMAMRGSCPDCGHTWVDGKE
mmetsp:Transcript_70968/g.191065  ORF Transcript_70968/g.191065 Transcript_70968/m.191065 type:complete len:331 (+) Transcript_70968:185-1177(+)